MEMLEGGWRVVLDGKVRRVGFKPTTVGVSGSKVQALTD